MAPQFQGRFCQNCAKTVVDFTTMSDAEVVAWLLKQGGHTCGRFREDQLGKELVMVTAGRQRWTWQAVTLGLAAWLSAKTVDAKDNEFPPITEQQSQTTSPEQTFSSNITPAPDSLLAVRGRVIDGQIKEGIPGATVLVKGTNIATPTDVNGNFSLSIPKELLAKDQIVEFSFIGYMTSEKKLSELTASPLTTIALAPDLKGEFVTVVAGGAFTSRWYSPRSLYYRLRNLFR